MTLSLSQFFTESATFDSRDSDAELSYTHVNILTIDQKDEDTWHDQQEDKDKDKDTEYT